MAQLPWSPEATLRSSMKNSCLLTAACLLLLAMGVDRRLDGPGVAILVTFLSPAHILCAPVDRSLLTMAVSNRCDVNCGDIGT
jgi:hypothetical protein